MGQSRAPADARHHLTAGRVATAARLLRHPAQFETALRYAVAPERLSRYWPLAREIKRRRPRTIVEIGLYRGDRSHLMIAAALGAAPAVGYWGFDLFAANMTDELLISEASLPPLPVEVLHDRLARPGLDLHLVAGNTTETLAAADLPPVDFAFVDGGHSYETVRSDWENLQRFLHPGSAVVFDDYTNREPEIYEAYGVTRMVEEIDRRQWRVRRLWPVDTTVRGYGPFRTRLVLVQPR